MRWTIIGEKRKNGRKYYECRCECGTVKDVYYRSIESGKSESCGCLRRELNEDKAMDLTGGVFGKLRILNKDITRKGYWICECECGTRKSIKGTSLTKKKQPTNSCGCDQKKVAAKTGAKTVAENSKARIEENVAYHTNFQVIGTTKPGRNNTSGHKGVGYDKSRGKWTAYIQVHGGRKYLGRYDTKELAIEAREEAEELYFKPLLEERGKGSEEIR